jgi:hypothetical protein
LTESQQNMTQLTHIVHTHIKVLAFVTQRQNFYSRHAFESTLLKGYEIFTVGGGTLRKNQQWRHFSCFNTARSLSDFSESHISISLFVSVDVQRICEGGDCANKRHILHFGLG